MSVLSVQNLVFLNSAIHEHMCLRWSLLNGDFWNRSFLISDGYIHVFWTSVINL
jgi:hypothetical protein